MLIVKGSALRQEENENQRIPGSYWLDTVVDRFLCCLIPPKNFCCCTDPRSSRLTNKTGRLVWVIPCGRGGGGPEGFAFTSFQVLQTKLIDSLLGGVLINFKLFLSTNFVVKMICRWLQRSTRMKFDQLGADLQILFRPNLQNGDIFFGPDFKSILLHMNIFCST